MTNLMKTGRLTQTPMADVISCLGRRVNTHEYDKAKAEACHLMGIPDLISDSDSRREQRQLKMLEGVVYRVAKFIELGKPNGIDIVYAKLEEVTKLNKLIDSFNDYMKSNQLRFGFRQKIILSQIDIDELERLGVVFMRRSTMPNLEETS